MSVPTRPSRSMRKSVHPDLGLAEINEHNEAAGAKKVIIVQPDIVAPYVANTQLGAGKLIKITAAGTYDLKLVGKAFSAASAYGIGDIVVEAGFVYMANYDIKVPKAFDAADWRKVSTEVIAGIPNAAGDVVTTGRWHNAISVAGFEVEDDTEIPFISSRR